MRNLYIIAFLWALAINVFAQKKSGRISVDDRYWKFKSGTAIVDITKATEEELKQVASYAALLNGSVMKDHWLFAGTHKFKDKLMGIRLRQNTKAKIYEGRSEHTYIIEGNSDIELAVKDISRLNASDYRYHVLSNDREIVGWTIPGQFRTTSDGKVTYAYLGYFKAQPNDYLKIEIYNVKDYSDRDEIIIDCRPVKPVKPEVGIEYTRAGPNQLFYSSLELNRFADFITGSNVFHLADSLVRLRMIFSDSFSYDLKTELIRTIKGRTERLDLGLNSGSFYLYKEYWKYPGDYELVFTPMLWHPGGKPIYRNDQATHCKFTILPDRSFINRFSAGELIWAGIAICMALVTVSGLIIFYIRRRGQQKLKSEEQQKQLAKSQLDTVRSQLNPHFLFNALAGIQNLMNKNRIDEANRYLGKFASLTRNVLNNKELVSLAEEKKLVDDYLQMEQLRFGFNYEISVDTGTEPENIEIPAMLLQPFVENAIKHGIAAKEEGGKIEISFTNQEKDLILTVKDNGEGFNPDKNYDGLGLLLSRNRISLLNAIYKETILILGIESDKRGTTVTITLKYWL